MVDHDVTFRIGEEGERDYSTRSDNVSRTAATSGAIVRT